MQERHRDGERYFQEQTITAEKYVLPFLLEVKNIDESTSVLEIGCGKGGNLVPFLKKGCSRIVGVDLSKGDTDDARSFFDKMENGNNAKFICSDIYNVKPEDIGQFDIIITRNVLEHIHNQDKFMNFVKNFMKPEGKFFLGFPPWHNPFGGHQQMCKSKFLSRLPYFHILPKFMYKFIMKVFGETDSRIESLLEVKDTRITIERFERILKKEHYIIDKRIFYFINPNYEIKFGLKPRKAWKLISIIPFFRNFIITTNYYIISLNETLITKN